MPDPAHFAPPGPLGFGGAPLGNMFTRLDEATAEATLARRLGQRHALLRHRAVLWRRPVRAPHRPRAAQRPRDEFVLSTKVGRAACPTATAPRARRRSRRALPFRPVYDYSADGILRSFEDSLQRLGLTQIDIAYIHDLALGSHGAGLGCAVRPGDRPARRAR